MRWARNRAKIGYPSVGKSWPSLVGGGIKAWLGVDGGNNAKLKHNSVVPNWMNTGTTGLEQNLNKNLNKT